MFVHAHLNVDNDDDQLGVLHLYVFRNACLRGDANGVVQNELPHQRNVIITEDSRQDTSTFASNRHAKNVDAAELHHLLH